MEFVSLGSTCSIAYQLQQLNMRKVAYPFDWLRVDSFEDVTNLFKNNFSDFITSCEKIAESDKFPIIIGDEFPINEKKNDNHTNIMKNKYNMKFYHDFYESVIVNQIDEKYQRRIERLLMLIKGRHKICFIRDELKLNKLTNTAINEFLMEVKKINPLAIINIIIIMHNPKNNKIELESNEFVIVINDVNNFGGWHRPNIDWGELFKIENYS